MALSKQLQDRAVGRLVADNCLCNLLACKLRGVVVNLYPDKTK